ncbi:MAG: hypothetical protein JNK78_16630 [Planctomycetes bacterium]|nr:hypothetical protein [Planctomycetota bacterium]
MQLSSNLFTKPRRNPRLDKCLVDDLAHITLRQPREQGDHVTRVHLALLTIMRNPNLGTEVVRAEYGPATAAAVLRFKRERNILNTALHQTAPDNVVGKKTIAALDAEMLKKQLPPGRLPRVKMSPAPFVKLGFNSGVAQQSLVGIDLNDVLGLGQVLATLPLDIFVHFDGGDAASEGQRRRLAEAEFANKFATPAYLRTHFVPLAICFVGGRGDKNKAKEAADEVLQLRKSIKQGVTAIVGSSVGGLAALDCAKLLAGSVPLDYVAISDGAFFAPGEVSFSPFKISVPTSTISATTKKNFFQTFGHESLLDPRGPGGFMQGTEFHGPLDGFTNIDVEAQPSATLRQLVQSGARLRLLPDITPGRLKLLKGNSDSVHTAAAEQAAAEIEKDKVSLFKP